MGIVLCGNALEGVLQGAGGIESWGNNGNGHDLKADCEFLFRIYFAGVPW
jgi:hypothetical protein